MKKILTLMLLTFLIVGCTNSKKGNKQEDKFYIKKNSSWDASRIPLIPPYEIIKLNGTSEWDMNLIETPSSISNIKKLNIIQNNIIINSGETYCNYAKVKEAWFLIIPEKHIEKGFEKKEDFEKYISSYKLFNPKFYDIDKIYKGWQTNEKIDWFKMNN